MNDRMLQAFALCLQVVRRWGHVNWVGTLRIVSIVLGGKTRYSNRLKRFCFVHFHHRSLSLSGILGIQLDIVHRYQ